MQGWWAELSEQQQKDLDLKVDADIEIRFGRRGEPYRGMSPLEYLHAQCCNQEWLKPIVDNFVNMLWADKSHYCHEWSGLSSDQQEDCRKGLTADILRAFDMPPQEHLGKMTVQELNEWMLQVTVDVDAYGGSQNNTLNNLNQVVSGEAVGCQHDDPQTKIGSAIEAWYNDYMSHLVPVDDDKEEADDGEK